MSRRRITDIIARYGGEEFTAILPDILYEQAVEAAEFMRQNVEDLHMEHVKSEKYKIVTILFRNSKSKIFRGFQDRM